MNPIRYLGGSALAAAACRLVPGPADARREPIVQDPGDAYAAFTALNGFDSRACARAGIGLP